MSGRIPQLILYPLYPGGPQVKASSGTLNASSSFKTQANQFVPAYGVNLPDNLQASEADTYYTLTGTATISRRPIGEASSTFNGHLGFDGTVTGGLKSVSAPAVAPEIPNLYKKAAELLSISDLKMADLLALPEFRIPGVGMGLKVTTDGAGGIDTVAINPGARGVMGRPDATGDYFGGLNSAEISRGAVFSLTDLSINTGTAPVQQPTANQVVDTTTVTPVQNTIQPQYTVNKLDRNAGIFNLEEQALTALKSQNADLDRITPELERLYQLQAGDIRPENSVRLGPDSTQAQQMAASQVGLGVKTNEAFQANVVGLINANKQSESYASAFAPNKMDQVMNGKIAGAPWVGNQSAGTAGGGLGNSASFEMGAAVADAMSRKGKGATYIPFRMQSDTQEQGFGGSNPFMGANAGAGGSGGSQFGGQADQQYRPRKQLAFTA